VFSTFAAFFVLAALAAWRLPERRGESLEAVDADVAEAVTAPTG
jgi:MFS transporter, putative metabolite:H+ symporter